MATVLPEFVPPRGPFATLLAKATKYTAIVAAIMFVVAFLATNSGLPIEKRPLVLATGYALALGVVGMLYDVYKSVERFEAGLKSEDGELLTLERCQQDFLRLLADVPPGNLLEVDFIGLDFTKARDLFINFVERCIREKRNVAIRLLLLDENPYSRAFDPELVAWGANATGSVHHIARRLEMLGDMNGGSVRIAIRRYGDFPFIHGFMARERPVGRVQSPLRVPIIVQYFAFCRFDWRDPKHSLLWGEGEYRKLQGNPRTKDAANHMEMFLGYFSRLWATYKDSASLPTKAAAGPNSP